MFSYGNGAFHLSACLWSNLWDRVRKEDSNDTKHNIKYQNITLSVNNCALVSARFSLAVVVSITKLSTHQRLCFCLFFPRLLSITLHS